MVTVELLLFLKPRLKLSHELLQRTTLGSAAATGIDYARAVLMEDYKNGEVDSLEEEWSKEINYQLDTVTVTVKIEDEERKFPLLFLVEGMESDSAVNQGEESSGKNMSEETGVKGLKISEAGCTAFEELLHKSGLPPGWSKEAVDSLADWIDGDDAARSFGAEKEYYLISGYQPRNGLPQTLGELHLIKGFSPEVTKAVLPYLSTFSSRVNINTADPKVLESLSPDESLPVYFLVNNRPYNSVDEAIKIAQVTPKSYHQLEKYLDVKSSFFSVWSTASDVAGHTETVYAVLKRNGKEVKPIYYLQTKADSQPVAGRD